MPKLTNNLHVGRKTLRRYSSDSHSSAIESLKTEYAIEIDNIFSEAIQAGVTSSLKPFRKVEKCQLIPCTAYVIRSGEKRKFQTSGRGVFSLS